MYFIRKKNKFLGIFKKRNAGLFIVFHVALSSAFTVIQSYSFFSSLILSAICSFASFFVTVWNILKKSNEQKNARVQTVSSPSSAPATVSLALAFIKTTVVHALKGTSVKMEGRRKYNRCIEAQWRMKNCPLILFYYFSDALRS